MDRHRRKLADRVAGVLFPGSGEPAGTRAVHDGPIESHARDHHAGRVQRVRRLVHERETHLELSGRLRMSDRRGLVRVRISDVPEARPGNDRHNVEPSGMRPHEFQPLPADRGQAHPAAKAEACLLGGRSRRERSSRRSRCSLCPPVTWKRPDWPGIVFSGVATRSDCRWATGCSTIIRTIPTRNTSTGPQTKVFRALRDIAAGEEITINYNGDQTDLSDVGFVVR